LLRAFGELFVVVSDPEHDGPLLRVLHGLAECPDFLTSVAPMLRVVCD
jgi:hypothetical protein